MIGARPANIVSLIAVGAGSPRTHLQEDVEVGGAAGTSHADGAEDLRSIAMHMQVPKFGGYRLLKLAEVVLLNLCKVDDQPRSCRFLD